MTTGALLYLTAFTGQMIFFEYQRRSFKFGAVTTPPSFRIEYGRGDSPVSSSRPTYSRFEVVAAE